MSGEARDVVWHTRCASLVTIDTGISVKKITEDACSVTTTNGEGAQTTAHSPHT